MRKISFYKSPQVLSLFERLAAEGCSSQEIADALPGNKSRTMIIAAAARLGIPLLARPHHEFYKRQRMMRELCAVPSSEARVNA